MNENPHNQLIPAVIPIEIAQGYRVWYSTRLGGCSLPAFGNANMSYRQDDDESAVTQNRRALEEIVGWPIQTVHQVHSARVMNVNDNSEGVEKTHEVEADALVSHENSAVGVFGADCLPVLFVDPIRHIYAAAHCGRRGLVNGVIEETIKSLQAQGALLSDIKVTLGPCICGRCYEVGSEIAMEFENRFPGTATITRFGGVGIDLEKAALYELGRVGILPENLVDSLPRIAAATEYLSDDNELIELCNTDGEGQQISQRLETLENALCTLENPLWYSYRRAQLAGKKHSGRHLAVISMYESDEK